MAKSKHKILTVGDDAPAKKTAPAKAVEPAKVATKAPAPNPSIDIAEVRQVMVDALLKHAASRGTNISQWGAYAAAIRTVHPYFIKQWTAMHRGE